MFPLRVEPWGVRPTVVQRGAKRSEFMMRTKRFMVGGLVAGAMLLLATEALAQDAPTAQTTGASGGNGDYGYKFEDDPLAAGGFGPSDATIRVRPGPVRTTLIRPRTSFVPEMLKSVENI
jgi:hypothetical protein